MKPELLYNGMRFAAKRSVSPVAYCALHIKAGTRDEDMRYGGLAHLTEHLLFKGTEKKSASVVNSCIEKLGGELNAYTSKEETVIHATVLKEDIARAVNLLVEMAFTCTFPERGIQKEKGVVLEEIKSYKDSPAEQIYDDFEELLFAGTSLAMPVLGKASTLKRIGRSTLQEYYHSRFCPQNMVFTVVADIDGDKVRNLLLKALSKYPYRGVPAITGDPAVKSRETAAASPFVKSRVRRSHQAHCLIGAPAYSLYDPRRVPLLLLVNMLGGPMSNSRLNMVLRERNALVYSVESSYSQYRDCGTVTVYFGCDKAALDKCSRLVHRELSAMRDNLVSDRALREAKKQYLGQLAIASDSGESCVLAMGKSILSFGEAVDMGQTRERIMAVTAGDLRDAAADIFAEERLSTLVYV